MLLLLIPWFLWLASANLTAANLAAANLTAANLAAANLASANLTAANLAAANLIHAQTCTLLGEQWPFPRYPDSYLNGYTISHFMDFTLDRCVLECFLLARCKSLNHNAYRGECELNGKTVEEVGQRSLSMLDLIFRFDYHDLSDWDSFKAMAGTCATRPCAENQRCIQTTPFTCADVDCGAPPRYPYTAGGQQAMITASPEMTSLGSWAYYGCNLPWTRITVYASTESRFLPRINKVCSSDNTWSGYPPICYRTIRTCSDIKKCNPALTDGHYWVFYYFERYKVYCHDMATSPKMYITLQHADNVAYDAGDGQIEPTLTRYSKIRVDGSSYEVNVTDHTFATKEGPGKSLDFASGTSCHGDSIATKSVSAYFKFNLAGTGFIMDKNNLRMFAGTPEYTNPEDFFFLEGNNETELHGTCTGTCVSCGIEKAYLIYSHGLDVAMETNVTFASCV